MTVTGAVTGTDSTGTGANPGVNWDCVVLALILLSFPNKLLKNGTAGVTGVATGTGTTTGAATCAGVGTTNEFLLSIGVVSCFLMPGIETGACIRDCTEPELEPGTEPGTDPGTVGLFTSPSTNTSRTN